MDVEQIYGVDFSGSRSDAGRKIWIASGEVTESGLEIEECICAADKFDAGMKRGRVLEELVAFISNLDSNSLIALDFSFSLPSNLIDSESWEEFVRGFPPADYASPDELSKHSKSSGGHSKRATDRETSAKPPGHWLIKHQTFYGLRNVLKPIIENGFAVVYPFQNPQHDLPVVLETYPAATFEELNAHRTGYTDVTLDSESRRDENLAALRERGVMIRDREETRALTNDDALDSIACASAAWSAIDDLDCTDDFDSMEGRIFV